MKNSLISRLMRGSAAALLLCAMPAFAKTLTVGFAQTGAESAWRTANTDSMKSEAEKRVGRAHFAASLEGYPLTFTIEPE